MKETEELIKVCKRCKREMRKSDFYGISKAQFRKKVYCSAECRSPQIEKSATPIVSFGEFSFDLWLKESPPESFKLWVQKNETYIKKKYQRCNS